MTTQTVEQQVENFLKDRGIEYSFNFIPQKYSEITAETVEEFNRLQYNWIVKIRVTCPYSKRDILEWEQFPYFTGLGHQKLTKNIGYSMKVADAETIKWAVCGLQYSPVSGNTNPAKLDEPEITDVLACLVMDASCTDYTFPEFCDEFGYDVDSISALETFNECVKIARQLSNIFSPADLDTLREMLQDY